MNKRKQWMTALERIWAPALLMLAVLVCGYLAQATADMPEVQPAPSAAPLACST